MVLLIYVLKKKDTDDHQSEFLVTIGDFCYNFSVLYCSDSLPPSPSTTATESGFIRRISIVNINKFVRLSNLRRAYTLSFISVSRLLICYPFYG